MPLTESWMQTSTLFSKRSRSQAYNLEADEDFTESYRVIQFLIFLGDHCYILHDNWISLHSHQNVKFSDILTNIYYWLFFNTTTLECISWYLIMVLIHIFLIFSDTEYILVCLLGVLFERMSYANPFLLILKSEVFLFLLRVVWILCMCILDTNPYIWRSLFSPFHVAVS